MTAFNVHLGVRPASMCLAEPPGASGKSLGNLERGSSSPRSRFAGLSSTIRGHSHPTMREEVEKRRRSKAGLIQQQQQPLQASHAALEEKLSRNSAYSFILTMIWM
ncbi:hypothetical protein PBY51_005540 [Eleginops maclovinus]|uniref:Uncharacterized protein n=1 Tax=Eleginops maclovinus TaxID=56733 RepID=A0AAN7X8K1_ELEMC|nr:hypothetical protein PBY51_005540 [Eleginops maclovinus]